MRLSPNALEWRSERIRNDNSMPNTHHPSATTTVCEWQVLDTVSRGSPGDWPQISPQNRKSVTDPSWQEQEPDLSNQEAWRGNVAPPWALGRVRIDSYFTVFSNKSQATPSRL